MTASVMTINHSKDKFIKPLLVTLKDHEFSHDLQQELNKEFAQTKPFNKSITIQITDVDSKQLTEIEKIKKQAPSGYTFVEIPSDYRLSEKSEQLSIDAHPTIILKRNNKLTTIYKNDISYTSRLNNPERQSYANIKQWAKDKGKLIHLAYKKAAHEIAYQLINDIKALDNQYVMESKQDKVLSHFNHHFNNAVVIKNNKNESIIRTQTGTISIEDKLIA